MIHFMSFYSGYYDGKYVWAVSINAPILCKIRADAWIVEKIYQLPDWADFMIYKQVVCVNHKLLFFPWEGDDLLLFDLDKESFYPFLSKDFQNAEGNVILSTGDVKEDEQNIYLIPKNQDSPFLIINKSSRETRILSAWKFIISQILEKGFQYRTTLSALVYDRLYMPVAGTEFVIILNVETCEIILKRLNLCGLLLHSMAECGKNIVINFVNSTKLIIWDGDEEQFHLSNEDIQYCDNIPYYRCIDCGEKLIILPYLADRNVRLLQPHTMQISEFHDFPKEFKVLKWDGTTFYGYYRKENNIYLLPLRGNNILELDTENKKTVSFPVRYAEGVRRELEKLFGKNGEKLDAEGRSLKFLLMKVKANEKVHGSLGDKNGAKIWQTLNS